MRIRHHGDLENIFMSLTELEGTFPLWEDPFGGPPEPTPLQWRADQMRYIESVPNWRFVYKYFLARFILNSEKVSYKICSERLSEFNLDDRSRNYARVAANAHMKNIEFINKTLSETESRNEFRVAIQKISELRHQGKILKFSEWMRT